MTTQYKLDGIYNFAYIKKNSPIAVWSFSGIEASLLETTGYWYYIYEYQFQNHNIDNITIIGDIKRDIRRQANQKQKMLEQFLYFVYLKKHKIQQQKINNEFYEIILQADNFHKMIELQLVSPNLLCI